MQHPQAHPRPQGHLPHPAVCHAALLAVNPAVKLSVNLAVSLAVNLAVSLAVKPGLHSPASAPGIHRVSVKGGGGRGHAALQVHECSTCWQDWKKHCIAAFIEASNSRSAHT
jgi:hypothetical protein